MNLPINKIKFYQYPDKYNVGDNLSEPILRHFLGDIHPVKENHKGKLVAVGSVMSKVLPGDIVWGTGCMRRKAINVKAKFLAVRGKLTRALIGGSDVPEVYGDPALLLPMIYNPKIEKKYKVGYVPHYADKNQFKPEEIIDVALPWKQFVDRVLECEKIVSSSLHGIVIAEAYGIPAKWEVYSDKVIGKGFKFRDYLTGTGRQIQGPGDFPPIKNLDEIQKKLVDALLGYYKNRVEYKWNPEAKWKGRLKMIAQEIEPGKSVIDLGGGMGFIREYIKPKKYTSLDLKEWNENTIKADFNGGQFPDVEKSDYVVCSGILEYIKEPKEFLWIIGKYGDKLIVSYRKNERSPIWRNDMRIKDVRELLQATGWRVIKEKAVQSKVEQIFICKKI